MKGLKRVLCVCLTLAMLLSMLPLSVYAATEMKLTASTVSQKLNAGDQIDVDVTMTDNPGLVGGRVTVGFDNEKFKLVDVKNRNQTITSKYDGYTKFPITSGTYKLSWDGGVLEENIMGDGVIATLTFEVLDTATVGESVIELSAPDFINFDLEKLAATCKSGKIALWA